MLKIIALVVTLVLSASAMCSDRFDNCFLYAGEQYDVEPILLKAIAIQESSLDSRATNSAGDVGLMQINSQWFPKLEAHGISRQLLLDSPCTNVLVSAWILAHNFSQYGRTWRAVGIYHAGTSKKPEVLQRSQSYIKKIQLHYSKLIRNSR